MSVLDLLFLSAGFITIVAAIAVVYHFTANFGE
jgi:hypothetical protein